MPNKIKLDGVEVDVEKARAAVAKHDAGCDKSFPIRRGRTYKNFTVSISPKNGDRANIYHKDIAADGGDGWCLEYARAAHTALGHAIDYAAKHQ